MIDARSHASDRINHDHIVEASSTDDQSHGEQRYDPVVEASTTDDQSDGEQRYDPVIEACYPFIVEIHAGGPNTSLKATCRRHKDCVCWVSTTVDSRQAVMVELLAWLRQGVDVTNKIQHEDLANEVKRWFGMRVRT